jgi:gag-polypeptide of LTR copia-type/Zinc knuckle
MENDVMREFRQYEVAKEMWLALNQKFGETSVTKLRQLTIKFDTYKKRPNHCMRQHLREMSNMISELKDANHILTDEQQVQAVICSLPQTWEHMKVNLTHNDGIKTLNDAVRHLELEKDRIEALKPHKTETTMHLAGSSSYGGQCQKRKSNDGKGKGKQQKKYKGQYRGKGKASQNNSKKYKKVKIKCFNCGKKGHYARECNEPRKVQIIEKVLYFSYVSSSIFTVDSYHLWTVDSRATDHVAKDRDLFLDFCQFLKEQNDFM